MTQPALWGIDPQLFANEPADRFAQFTVTWYRSFVSVRQISIDVVARSVAMKNASRVFQFSNKNASLHDSMTIGLARASEGASLSSSNMSS